ncbi:MAG: N-acetylglucosamine-6-phosphate deacetylase [Thermodesulfovibrionales bacterium]
MIDLHIHGLGRWGISHATDEAIENISILYGSMGIKAFLPVIMPDELKRMRALLDVIKRVIKKGSPGAKILGAYLEGPFLNPEYAGSLKKEYFLPSTPEGLRRLIDGYEDIIKIITIAPELPGSLKLIEECRILGIKVHMGHSGATYKEALEGKVAGATGITHLFNAMRPLHHREPGITGLGLLDKDLYVELICDGIHIAPEILRLVFSIKPSDKIIAISDAIVGAGDLEGASYNSKGRLRGSLYPINRARVILETIDISHEVIEMVTYKNPERYISK